MKTKIMLGILVVILMSGCIWIDDDHDDYCCNNYEEEIVYVNHTNYSVDNFIDDEFVGSVTPDSELHVFGYDYDGYHVFYSRCINFEFEWGPDEFFIYDGETFTIYLEMDGSSQFRTSRM